MKKIFLKTIDFSNSLFFSPVLEWQYRLQFKLGHVELTWLQKGFGAAASQTQFCFLFGNSKNFVRGAICEFISYFLALKYFNFFETFYISRVCQKCLSTAKSQTKSKQPRLTNFEMLFSEGKMKEKSQNWSNWARVEQASSLRSTQFRSACGLMVALLLVMMKNTKIVGKVW